MEEQKKISPVRLKYQYDSLLKAMGLTPWPGNSMRELLIAYQKPMGALYR